MTSPGTEFLPIFLLYGPQQVGLANMAATLPGGMVKQQSEKEKDCFSSPGSFSEQRNVSQKPSAHFSGYLIGFGKYPVGISR